MTDNDFKFRFSLTVLNHLGRGLYRNFATVLAEAISNSWDADARNVYINKKENFFSVKDDGIGMSRDDFRNKFLKIGYSKRGANDNNTKSIGRRPYIGRKGIGKLALLSCAEKISIFSKKENMDKYISGVIDNSELNKSIEADNEVGNYDIPSAKHDLITSLEKDHSSGTIIVFEGVNEGIRSTLKNLKEVIALYFKFSLLDKNFNIYMNDEKITETALDKLATNSQFLWKINDIKDNYYRFVEGKILKQRQRQLDESMEEDKARPLPKEMSFPFEKDGVSYDITGFVASAKKPGNLNIRGLSEKVTVDVFANGRLRQRNIISGNTQIGAN